MTHGPEIPLRIIYATDEFAHLSKDMQHKDIYCGSAFNS